MARGCCPKCTIKTALAELGTAYGNRVALDMVDTQQSHMADLHREIADLLREGSPKRELHSQLSIQHAFLADSFNNRANIPFPEFSQQVRQTQQAITELNNELYSAYGIEVPAEHPDALKSLYCSHRNLLSSQDPEATRTVMANTALQNPRAKNWLLQFSINVAPQDAATLTMENFQALFEKTMEKAGLGHLQATFSVHDKHMEGQWFPHGHVSINLVEPNPPHRMASTKNLQDKIHTAMAEAATEIGGFSSTPMAGNLGNNGNSYEVHMKQRGETPLIDHLNSISDRLDVATSWQEYVEVLADLSANIPNYDVRAIPSPNHEQQGLLIVAVAKGLDNNNPMAGYPWEAERQQLQNEQKNIASYVKASRIVSDNGQTMGMGSLAARFGGQNFNDFAESGTALQGFSAKQYRENFDNFITHAQQNIITALNQANNWHSFLAAIPQPLELKPSLNEDQTIRGLVVTDNDGHQIGLGKLMIEQNTGGLKALEKRFGSFTEYQQQMASINTPPQQELLARAVQAMEELHSINNGRATLIEHLGNFGVDTPNNPNTLFLSYAKGEPFITDGTTSIPANLILPAEPSTATGKSGNPYRNPNKVELFNTVTEILNSPVEAAEATALLEAMGIEATGTKDNPILKNEDGTKIEIKKVLVALESPAIAHDVYNQITEQLPEAEAKIEKPKLSEEELAAAATAKAELVESAKKQLEKALDQHPTSRDELTANLPENWQLTQVEGKKGLHLVSPEGDAVSLTEMGITQGAKELDERLSQNRAAQKEAERAQQQPAEKTVSFKTRLEGLAEESNSINSWQQLAERLAEGSENERFTLSVNNGKLCQTHNGTTKIIPENTIKNISERFNFDTNDNPLIALAPKQQLPDFIAPHQQTIQKMVEYGITNVPTIKAFTTLVNTAIPDVSLSKNQEGDLILTDKNSNQSIPLNQLVDAKLCSQMVEKFTAAQTPSSIALEKIADAFQNANNMKEFKALIEEIPEIRTIENKSRGIIITLENNAGRITEAQVQQYLQENINLQANSWADDLHQRETAPAKPEKNQPQASQQQATTPTEETQDKPKKDATHKALQELFQLKLTNITEDSARFSNWGEVKAALIAEGFEFSSNKGKWSVSQTVGDPANPTELSLGLGAKIFQELGERIQENNPATEETPAQSFGQYLTAELKERNAEKNQDRERQNSQQNRIDALKTSINTILDGLETKPTFSELRDILAEQHITLKKDRGIIRIRQESLKTQDNGEDSYKVTASFELHEISDKILATIQKQEGGSYNWAEVDAEYRNIIKSEKLTDKYGDITPIPTTTNPEAYLTAMRDLFHRGPEEKIKELAKTTANAGTPILGARTKQDVILNYVEILAAEGITLMASRDKAENITRLNLVQQDAEGNIINNVNLADVCADAGNPSFRNLVAQTLPDLPTMPKAIKTPEQTPQNPANVVELDSWNEARTALVQKIAQWSTEGSENSLRKMLKENDFTIICHGSSIDVTNGTMAFSLGRLQAAAELLIYKESPKDEVAELQQPLKDAISNLREETIPETSEKLIRIIKKWAQDPAPEQDLKTLLEGKGCTFNNSSEGITINVKGIEFLADSIKKRVMGELKETHLQEDGQKTTIHDLDSSKRLLSAITSITEAEQQTGHQKILGKPEQQAIIVPASIEALKTNLFRAQTLEERILILAENGITVEKSGGGVRLVTEDNQTMKPSAIGMNTRTHFLFPKTRDSEDVAYLRNLGDPAIKDVALAVGQVMQDLQDKQKMGNLNPQQQKALSVLQAAENNYFKPNHIPTKPTEGSNNVKRSTHHNHLSA